MTATLVGRDAELGELDRAVRAVVAGTSSLYEVTGPAGSGRSAVLRHVLRTAAREDLTVLTASTSPGGVSRQRGVVGALLSELEPAIYECPVAFTSARLVGLLLEAARRRPLVVVVDDAQWLDEESWRWLRSVSHRLAEAAVMIVVSSDGIRPVLDGARVLPLRPLGLAATQVVVAARWSERADDEFLEAAARCTRGRPAVLAAVLDQMALARLSPRAEHVPELVARAADVIGDAVTRLLQALPAEVVAVLRVIAVCGPEFDLDLVWSLVSPRTATRARALELLLSSGLVTDCAKPGLAEGVDPYRVLAGMDYQERLDLHTRAARLGFRAAVAERGLARVLAGSPPLGEPWAVQVLRTAAARDREQGRSVEAARHLERALKEPSDELTRARLTVELAVAESGHTPEVGDRRLAWVLLSEERPELADVRLHAADQLVARGDDVFSRRTLALVRAAGADRDTYSALYWLADDAPHEQPGLGVLETADVPDLPTDHAGAGVAAWRHAVRGTDLTTSRALARFALTGSPGVLTPRMQACRTLLLTDDFEEAITGLDEVLALARRRGLNAVAGRALAVRGWGKLRLGRLEDAAVDLDSAAEEMPVAGWHPAVRSHLIALDILLSVERGLLDRASRISAEAALGGTDGGFAWAHLLFARSVLALRLGEPEVAARHVQECGRRLLARRWTNPALFTWRSLAASALHARGEGDEAVRLVTEELDLARGWGTPSALAAAHLGAVAVLSGQAATDSGLAAVRLLADSPARVAYAAALLGLASVSGGDEAAALVREAAEIALTHHARLLLVKARQLGWNPGD